MTRKDTPLFHLRTIPSAGGVPEERGGSSVAHTHSLCLSSGSLSSLLKSNAVWGTLLTGHGSLTYGIGVQRSDLD